MARDGPFGVWRRPTRGPFARCPLPVVIVTNANNSQPDGEKAPPVSGSPLLEFIHGAQSSTYSLLKPFRISVAVPKRPTRGLDTTHIANPMLS
jgi:hypothetical protein